MLPDLYGREVAPVLEPVLFHGVAQVGPITGSEIEDILPELIGSGLAPLLVSIAEGNGLRLSVGAHASLRAAQFDTLVRTVRTQSATVEALQLLQANRIPFLIIKGPSIARLHTVNWNRPFNDIDIIVPRHHYLETIRLLRRELAFAEAKRNALPRSGSMLYCREATNLRNDLGGSIDVHQQIAPWIWTRRLSYEVLARDGVGIEIGGVNMQCASAIDNFLISMLHIVSDRGQPGTNLLCWRDIALLATTLDVDKYVARADELGLRAWTAWILGCLPSIVRPTNALSLLGEDSTRIPHPRRLRVVASGVGSGDVLAVQAFRIPMLNALVFALSAACPSREFLQDKYGRAGAPEYFHYWRSGGLGVKEVLLALIRKGHRNS